MNALTDLWIKGKNKFLDLLFGADNDMLEFSLGWLMLFWGVWFLLFTRETHNLSYAVLQEWPIPAWMIGGAFCLAGLAQIIGPLFYHLSWRRKVAFSVLFLWMYLAAAIWVSNPRTTGGIIYTTISLMQLWVYTRLKVRKNGK